MLKKRVILTWLVVALLTLSTVPVMASEGKSSEEGLWSWLEGMVSALLTAEEPTPQVEGDDEPDPDTGEVGDLFEPHG